MVKNMLSKKLFRDMTRAKGQFLSIIILSALGVLIFSGLDAAWRDIDLSVNDYFEDQQLADFWVTVPSEDRDVENKISRLQGVEVVQSRISIEVAADLPGEPALMVHALDEEARINVPVVQSGTSLSDNDQAGCLLEEQFAQAHNISVGDKLTIRINRQEHSFIIRGLVMSPEYIITAKDATPDPQSYGFMIANSVAFPQVPMNEMTVLLSDTADSQEVKDEIEAALPYALVRDRTAHSSTEMIRGEITQYRSLSSIFPVVFFAVSALVVLTTMTRMVDSQRMQIGILKAVGYRDGQIFRHFLSYGFLPSLIGSASGLLIGRHILTNYIWKIESDIGYVLPLKIASSISIEVLMVCCLPILLSCLICYYVCRKNLKEVPASLLRPKPPKGGSRILLERFPAFWKRLKFNTKMIQRNLFRSKARTMMALLGVLGCTALLITALGMQDTFQDVVSTYYGQTLRYDLRVELTADAGILTEYQQKIPAQTVEGIMEKIVSVKGENNDRIVVMSVLDGNQTQINLEPGILPREGMVMTEKLASVMGVQAGDTITIRIPGDSSPVRLKIARLVPIGMGQGIYLSADQWESLEKGAFTPTALLIKKPSEGAMGYLDRLEEADSTEWISSQKENTLAGMQGMISIIILMAVFALTLAFVVLYNLGILNFVERTREFATLKVLGYHQREICSLIIRENMLISSMGIALGIMPGLWLTSLAIHVSEPDNMAITSYVSILSLAAACGLTLLFSLLIQLFLTRKVKSIDMVGALKSVE